VKEFLVTAMMVVGEPKEGDAGADEHGKEQYH
jgi:hypothetical protein